MIDSTFMSHYGFAIEEVWGRPRSYVRVDDSGDVWVVTDLDGLGLPSEGDSCLLWHYGSQEERDTAMDIEPHLLRNVSEVIRAIREVRHNV